MTVSAQMPSEDGIYLRVNSRYVQGRKVVFLGTYINSLNPPSLKMSCGTRASFMVLLEIIDYNYRLESFDHW